VQVNPQVGPIPFMKMRRSLLERTMKLNKLEFLAMNNPLRAYIQENYELRIFRNMTSVENIQRALEIGCGNGHGTKLIQKYFCPQKIIGIDLDERMINTAVKRNRNAAISYQVMDASELDFPDDYFDAIFDFGIIHHIPNWKDALKEMHRVLKPGGEVILEDLSIDSFSKDIGRLWRILSDHPYESMYTPGQFTEFLDEIGFAIRNYKESNPLGLIRFFSLNAVIKTISASH
jgi:ubiquinone/menaquinone biosynthesis C-methylase UbiE